MSAGDAQRALEQPDLFAPHLRRERVVDWQAPGAAAKATTAMSGMEAMQAIRDGILPPPPMAKLIGIRMTTVEPGRIVMHLEPEESLENGIGLLHGATAAALLDTAMGCAISTMLPAGQTSVTVKSGTVQAEGRLVKLGRQTSYTEGFVRDGASNLAVHATAAFSMVGGAEKAK